LDLNPLKGLWEEDRVINMDQKSVQIVTDLFQKWARYHSKQSILLVCDKTSKLLPLLVNICALSNTNIVNLPCKILLTDAMESPIENFSIDTRPVGIIACANNQADISNITIEIFEYRRKANTNAKLLALFTTDTFQWLSGVGCYVYEGDEREEQVVDYMDYIKDCFFHYIGRFSDKV